MKKLEVLDYNPEWKSWFEELKASIFPAVSSYAYGIEHVGSTAVEGLAAKPIIDIDIIVNSEGAMKKCINALKSIGYEHLGDLGIIGREAFKIKETSYEHNLYVCYEDVDSLKNHLILRDHLRNNRSDRDKYGGLKKRLASDFSDDRALYLEGKTEFILSILEKYNFKTDSLSSIKEANRKK